MKTSLLASTAHRFGLVAVMLALLAGCSGTRIVDTLVPSSGYTSENAAYGNAERQQLDIYRPLAPVAPPPIVVFFYGGTWSHGERADYRFVGEALASRGAIVVIPDYRLSPQVKYPVFLQDSARAVRWVFDHAAALGGDASRIVVMGHSSGAYNAAEIALDERWLGAVGLSPSRLAGWIGLAGPYDFLPIDNPQAQVAFNWPDTPRDSQPIAHAGRPAPRTLLIAANTDALVNPDRNTEGLAERLRAAGTDVTVQRYDHVNHVTLIGSLATPLRFLAPVREDILKFLGLEKPG